MARHKLDNLNNASRSTIWRRNSSTYNTNNNTQSSNSIDSDFNLINVNQLDTEMDLIDNHLETEINSTNSHNQSDELLINNLTNDHEYSNESNENYVPVLCNELVKLISQNHLNNKTTDQILKLLHSLINEIKNGKKIDDFPKNRYFFLKYLNLNLDKKFYLKTDCCKIVIEDFKEIKQIFCLCKKDNDDEREEISRAETILSRNYFFRFNLHQQLEYLLNYFKIIKTTINENLILSPYDGLIYKKYSNLKQENVITFKMSIDGVPIFKKTQLWPIFFCVNELDCKEDQKIFTNSCFLSEEKPDVYFLLSELVLELNNLYKYGILIKESNTIVYPMLTNVLIDSGARSHFVNHSHFNSEFGCSNCYAKGYRPADYPRNHIYKNESTELRSKEECLDIIYLIENNLMRPPYIGIKGRCIFSEIEYFDWVVGIHNEPMHNLLPGVLRRIYECMSDSQYRNRKCFLKKKERKLIDKRIEKIAINSSFKRNLELFTKVSNYKSNQIFDFSIYIAPIVLNNILDDEVYNHLLLIIYVIGKLWEGGFERSQLILFKKIIEEFVENVEHYYLDLDYTFNLHQLVHLPDVVDNFGPLKFNNMFKFESENHEIKKLVSGPHGILEQIAERTEISFMHLKMMNNNYQIDKNFKTTGKSYKFNNRLCYKKIKNDNKIITSFYNIKKKKTIKSIDYFVETNNAKFFKILYYFEENSEIKFCGLKIKKKDKIYASSIIGDLKFDYILKAIITSNKMELPISCIKDKVLFLPEFNSDEDLDEISDENRGFILQTYFTYHN